MELSLKRAMQFIKGGFSFRARRKIPLVSEIWKASFVNHRIRDACDYKRHYDYIRDNPVRAGLCDSPEELVWSSAARRVELDEPPPGLKPQFSLKIHNSPD
jgi:putative transposase